MGNFRYGVSDDLAKLAQRGVKHVAIPTHVDKRFRDGLKAAAATVSVKVGWAIRTALDEGPRPGGAKEAIAYFGAELDLKLKLTAPIIDLLEVSMPGFKRWLVATRFADDRHMIAAFVQWAETSPLFGSTEGVLGATKETAH
jgi:hypothetical protein